jgi:hypothetical protein
MFYLILAFGTHFAVILPKAYDSLAACQASGVQNITASLKQQLTPAAGQGGIGLDGWTCVKQ